MISHAFRFEGGEELQKMGATWFVSYAYHDRVDKEHDNWSRVRTVDVRKSCYNRTGEYHKAWLEHVLGMNPRNLAKNTIGLAPAETKAMARRILAVID